MALILDKVNYTYEAGSGFEKHALKDVSCAIDKGEFIGLIGHTGSGKSTLIQHMNGIIKATSGNIFFDGEDIYDKDYDMRKLRNKVGLVFQYPEHQLFETDIFKDVCFGPRNQGLSEKDVQLRAFEALRLVGLEENLYYQSPFDLSGGQKRRAAIAGVLAMRPDYLILDEPTRGIDIGTKTEIQKLVLDLADQGMAVTFISSEVEEMLRTCSRMAVLRDGQKVGELEEDELSQSGVMKAIAGGDDK